MLHQEVFTCASGAGNEVIAASFSVQLERAVV